MLSVPDLQPPPWAGRLLCITLACTLATFVTQQHLGATLQQMHTSTQQLASLSNVKEWAAARRGITHPESERQVDEIQEQQLNTVQQLNDMASKPDGSPILDEIHAKLDRIMTALVSPDHGATSDSAIARTDPARAAMPDPGTTARTAPVQKEKSFQQASPQQGLEHLVDPLTEASTPTQNLAHVNGKLSSQILAARSSSTAVHKDGHSAKKNKYI